MILFYKHKINKHDSKNIECIQFYVHHIIFLVLIFNFDFLAFCYKNVPIPSLFCPTINLNEICIIIIFFFHGLIILSKSPRELRD